MQSGERPYWANAEIKPPKMGVRLAAAASWVMQGLTSPLVALRSVWQRWFAGADLSRPQRESLRGVVAETVLHPMR